VFLIATYAVPFVTNWLSQVTAGHSHGVRFDLHDVKAVAIIVFLFVITTPVSEEILYRGLLVAWLRRVGWTDSAIWLVGSLIFAANHIISLGFLWSAAMVVLGAILFGLRLRYESLTPAWLTHILFNAHLILPWPLSPWGHPRCIPDIFSPGCLVSASSSNGDAL
jgi:membrane protease YdiL (CAAX protease family)